MKNTAKRILPKEKLKNYLEIIGLQNQVSDLQKRLDLQENELHSVAAFINRYRDRLEEMLFDPTQGIYHIELDYPIFPIPRYGHGKPPHPRLFELINANRGAYRQILDSFLSLKEFFFCIPVKPNGSPSDPSWVNDYLPALDSLTLYGLLAQCKPGLFLEIGSGNSTKFARRAITDHNLVTKIVSIDPEPRSEVDALCDEVIRSPIEKADLSVFERLKPGDFLFIDNSHRCFTNSDVTVVFLDILPYLKPGVIVQIHDIILPFDYPASYSPHFYSEQYLLAVLLMAENDPGRILLPNAFIYDDLELREVLAPVWKDPRMAGVQPNGCSFWYVSR